MVTKRVRRRDGVVQRYHTKPRRVSKIVPKTVSVTFDRYKTMDFVDPDEPGAEIKGVKKVFQQHPELYGYLMLFESIGSHIGMLDDGYLPPDLQLYLKIPLQDYILLNQTGVMKPVTYNGVKGHRINVWTDTRIGDYPWKGKTWENGAKGVLHTKKFRRTLALLVKRRAQITSNKRVKDIKHLKEYIWLGGIMHYLLRK